MTHRMATAVVAALTVASAGLGLLAAFATPQAPTPLPAPLATGRIVTDASKPGVAIPSNLYGIFFEEINHAGDGGLYAELVRNRGFEDANLPPACVREGNFIVPPRTPHFDTGKPSDWRLRWDETDPHPAWSLNTPTGSAATIGLVIDRPLNDATPHSLQVDVAATAPGRAPQLVNTGHWGMSVVQGERYRLTFFARNDAPMRMTSILQSADGRTLAEQPVSLSAGGWRRLSIVMPSAKHPPGPRIKPGFMSAMT